MKACKLVGVAVLFLLCKTNASTHTDKVQEHPKSTRVHHQESANFTCTIDCSEFHTLKWRFYIPAVGTTKEFYLKSTWFNIFSSRNGVIVESIFKQESNCRHPGGQMTEVITIVATERTNSTIIQCAAVATRRGYANYYSKIAVLQTESSPEVPTPAESVTTAQSTVTVSLVPTRTITTPSPTPIH